MTNEDHTDFEGTLFLIFIKIEDNKTYSEREREKSRFIQHKGKTSVILLLV